MTPQTFARRRVALTTQVSAPILLMGNGQRSRNLPMNKVAFRQDSTFLYFTGCTLPYAAALLEGDTCTLFVPAPADGDALWHGHTASLAHLRETLGVTSVRPRSALEQALSGRTVRTLAVGDEEMNRQATALTGTPLVFGKALGDDDLIDAVIRLRRNKEPAEVQAIRDAARHTAVAFDAVIRGTRTGGHERPLAALFEGVLAARGLTTGYDTILTQAGEVLHNGAHDATLEDGRLLLLDGGGELASGYGVDITRAWPVNGVFSPRQRAAYDAVLAAQEAAIAAATPGVRNRAVHDAASRVLAEWLYAEGLLTVPPDVSLRTGAHAAFFPHGIGHFLGLDVHDLENFGDRPSYPEGGSRPEGFGTCYLRMDLPLEPGWVITAEPGFYVVPAILEDAALRAHFGDQVNYTLARDWYGFGGIRIEDDLLITAEGNDILTNVPKSADAIEAMIGTGRTPEERLCCS